MPVPKVRHSWDRQPGEGMKAYELFLQYVGLGVQRSLHQLETEVNRPWGLLQKLSSKYKWVRRAKAYDEHIIDIQQKAIEKTLVKDAVAWAKKRSDYRNKEYDLAMSLRDLASKMLEIAQNGLEETIEEDFTAVNGVLVPVKITKKPLKWSIKDIPYILEISSKLARLSMELETSRDSVTVNLANDPEARLVRAKAVLEKMQQNVSELVDKAMEADPTQDRSILTQQILESLPAWVAQDWNTPIEQLLDVIEPVTSAPALLLTEGEVVTGEEEEDNNIEDEEEEI